MEQKLKISKSTVVLELFVLVVLSFLCVCACCVFIENIYTRASLYDLFYSGFMFVISFFMVLVVAMIICNATVRALAFSNTEFSFKGKTYTYSQIEKIKTRKGKYNSKTYEIYVDGKRLYSFDDKYEGAKDFLSNLKARNVPGVPKW